MKPKKETGCVFDIQKFCVHDGPGIRTTVFLKGCNMRCKWCHNPESFKMTPELYYINHKCTFCKRCESVCKNQVHTIQGNIHHLKKENCTLCGECTRVCVQEAVKIMGKEMSVEEVVEEVIKDKIYYEESGGGVTISGGEATLQQDFLLALLKRLKQEDIHTAIETNGTSLEELTRELSKYTDLFLFDYKLHTDEDYIKWTNQSKTLIDKNLILLKELKKDVIIRCPIIPGVNDTTNHFNALKQLKKEYPNVLSMEIMAYHDTGKAKWENIGLKYDIEVETVSKELKKTWEEFLGRI